MEITINYSVMDSAKYPCCASARIGGEYVVALGETFDKAKADLIARIMARRVIVPEPETINLEVV